MSIEIGPETVNEITDRESRDTVEQRCTPSDGLSPDSQACVRALALVVHHPRHAPGGVEPVTGAPSAEGDMADTERHKPTRRGAVTTHTGGPLAPSEIERLPPAELEQLVLYPNGKSYLDF